MSRTERAQKPPSSSRKKTAYDSFSIAIVGAGSLGTFLAPALQHAGFNVTQIVSRNSPASLRRARRLAKKVGARAVGINTVDVDANIIWLCVPDREIRAVASTLSRRLRTISSAQKALDQQKKVRDARDDEVCCAFHSSGALASGELSALRHKGVAVASVHPLMTFVKGAVPSLTDVPFAIEGDRKAVGIARSIVAKLGGESFSQMSSSKAAYHAWATMASPLLIAFLVTLEEAAAAAGLTKRDARRMSMPIIQQTLNNYSRIGAPKSFSGPIVRGDVATVARHLSALKVNARASAVYKALARIAVAKLPARNKRQLRALLDTE